METPTMCEADCGSTCWCDWEECCGIWDDAQFLDKGLTQLTGCVYYKAGRSSNRGYAVVGDRVYEVIGTHTEGYDVHLLNGTLLVKHNVYRRSLYEPLGDLRWWEWTMVKFVSRENEFSSARPDHPTPE